MSLWHWDKTTPQVAGRRREKDLARELGARLHPMSGAGRIKGDMSTDGLTIESKSVARSFTVSGDYIAKLWLEAVREGCEPVLVVEFENGLRLTGVIERWRGP